MSRFEVGDKVRVVKPRAPYNEGEVVRVDGVGPPAYRRGVCVVSGVKGLAVCYESELELVSEGGE